MNPNSINPKINNVDFFNNKENSTSAAIDDWCTTKDFYAYKRYTLNSYFESINEALRSGFTNDFSIKYDIQQLDNVFKTIPEKIKPQKDMEVYRGAYLSDELKNIIKGNSKTNIYTDQGFVSTSKNINVANRFAKGNDKVLLHITIPKGSSVIEDEKLPSYARSKMKEEEVLLPRNSQFKILSYNPITKTVEAEFIGQKKPLDFPTYTEDSGRNTLSDINKIFINKKF